MNRERPKGAIDWRSTNRKQYDKVWAVYDNFDRFIIRELAKTEVIIFLQAESAAFDNYWDALSYQIKMNSGNKKC